ncbi:MAG: NlpC/P60 family protein [Eubacteriales bacterium]|nr:NlpC/P60 family protein [Eubacteriales bacterium]
MKKRNDKTQQHTGKVPQYTGSVPQHTGKVARQNTRPLPRQADGRTGPVPKQLKGGIKPHSKAHSVLLVVLPLVALALLGVLALLIVSMPKDNSVHMKKASLSRQAQRATQPTQYAPQQSKALDKLSPAKPRNAAKISKADVANLIKTGAGIPPGNQVKTQLAAEPSAMVWKSPVEYRPVDNHPIAAAGEQSTPPSQEQPADQGTPVQPEATTAEALAQPSELTDLATQAPVDAEIQEELVEDVIGEPQSQEALPTPEEQTYNHLSGGFEVTNLTAWVYGEVVNVRTADSMDAEIATELNAGDQVWELETNGSWSHVLLADGSEGYIYSSLLSYNFVPREEEIYQPEEPVYQENEFEPYYGTLYSLFSGVNIRREPSTSSEVIGTMYYGDYCEAVGYSGGWFQISWYDGEVAYVYGDNLTTDPISSDDLNGEIQHEEVQYIASDIPTVENPADLAGGSAVANLALQYVGYPYVYGTAGPNTFDCSGFAQYIYSQMGVSIGRSTYDQIYDGIPISFGYKDYSAMVPGDLVFFGEGTNVYHVGIYIGGGQMVHAGTESTGVVIDSLNMDYWAARIAGIRRIFY